MRIAIDARELNGRATGVGRYLSEILSAWCELPAAARHELILCAPAAVDLSRWSALNIRTLGASAGSSSTFGARSAAAEAFGAKPAAGPRPAGTLWEQTALPQLVRRANADVLWAPAYTGPLWLRVPMVLTVHDVSFAAHPEWFSPREGWRRRLVTRMAARRAVRVLTVSNYSKEEIVRYLRVDENRIEIIYSGVRPLAVANAHAREGGLGLRDRGLVLFVGSLLNRRHVPELIEAFARLASRHREARLEIVGDNRTHPRIDLDALVAKSGMGSRIAVRSYVSDRELASLYARASAFAFLSEYEGFGFTPLEALAAGVPMVVLDTPIAREIYGPAAIYVHQPEPSIVDAALERALFDEDERARLIDAAQTVLPRYSWDECAHRTLQALVSTGR